MYFPDKNWQFDKWTVRAVVIPCGNAVCRKSAERGTARNEKIGRPRVRWLEDVIAHLKRMGISGWMDG